MTGVQTCALPICKHNSTLLYDRSRFSIHWVILYIPVLAARAGQRSRPGNIQELLSAAPIRVAALLSGRAISENCCLLLYRLPCLAPLAIENAVDYLPVGHPLEAILSYNNGNISQVISGDTRGCCPSVWIFFCLLELSILHNSSLQIFEILIFNEVMH